MATLNNVKITESTAVAELQPPVPVTVIVSVTVPAVISAAVGVYIGVLLVVLLNDPVPEVVQRIAPFEEVPFNV